MIVGARWLNTDSCKIGSVIGKICLVEWAKMALNTALIPVDVRRMTDIVVDGCEVVDTFMLDRHAAGESLY